MPWPLAQQRAIFLRIKRQKGEAAARDFMHKHGYPNDNKAAAKSRLRKRARH